MARQPDHRGEMREAMRREPWALSGPNRIVKVLPIARPLSAALRGYVCAEKSLLGKTPQRIESALDALS